MSEHSGSINRREFLARSGRGVALAGLGASAAQAKTPVEKTDPHAPKTGRLLAEDEVIGIGVIGVGGMGNGHVRELAQREVEGELQQVRAVSDVYEQRNRRARNTVNGQTQREIESYMDYTELLARDDIHAVVVATPDHWHAQIALDAMDAGKDVYLQKPFTYTIDEAIAVRDKAFTTGRVLQCGAQGCSNDLYWQAKDLIAKGGIGKVLWAQADVSRNSAGGPDDRGGEWNYGINDRATDDPGAGTDYIDWQRWLGSAPKIPYNPNHFFQFRKYWAYSGGIATDLHYHVVAPLTIALGLSAPERVTGSGGIYIQHDDREVPDTYFSQVDYPEDLTLVLTASMANRSGPDMAIRGHRATIHFQDEPNKGLRVVPEKEFKDWFVEQHGKEELFIEAAARDDHMTNFLTACRTRGPVHCDPETAYRAMVAIRLGVDSYRQDKVMFYDPIREQVVDQHPRPDRASKVPV